MDEKVKNYLLNGCDSLEELELDEKEIIFKQYNYYIGKYMEEIAENRKTEYFNVASCYRDALDSPFYAKAAAVNTARKNIAKVLDGKNLLTSVYLNNVTSDNKDYVDYFVSIFGPNFINTSELINLRYEDIRKILYNIVDLEFIPIDIILAEKTEIENGILTQSGNYPIASYVDATTLDGLNLLIKGKNLPMKKNIVKK